MIRRRPVLSIFTPVYLVLVGVVTLTPQRDSGSDSWTHRIVDAITSTPLTSWMSYDGIEFTANVVMFVPMGLLFTLLLGRRRWWVALAIGVAATCLIEFSQLFIPGRVSDVRDLIANTLGTAVGIGVAFIGDGLAASRRGALARE
ncbi:VanZ family protein [Leifsonia poae]|uniref:VanZ family protein n=1 Tax=Leifsonia poae TaxID=110933 RepID=UPI001CBF41CE|nr:VanZ family protein [Leifsonia poae]